SLEAGDQLEDGGLPRPARAQQRQELALSDVEVHAGNRAHLTEQLDQAAHVERRHAVDGGTRPALADSGRRLHRTRLSARLRARRKAVPRVSSVAMAVMTGSTPYRTLLKMATGRVTKPVPLRKLVMTVSSKEPMKAKMADATIAGTSRRSVMSSHDRSRLAPRLRAAISRLRGTRVMAAPVISSTYGSASVMWTATTPSNRPSSRASARREYSATGGAMLGTRSGASPRTWTTRRPGVAVR